MLCELCAVNSGRVNAFRHCCMVRGLAQSPEHRRKAYYATLKACEVQQLREEVKAERQRLRDMKRAKNQDEHDERMTKLRGILKCSTPT